jgi:hypothetical protein
MTTKETFFPPEVFRHGDIWRFHVGPTHSPQEPFLGCVAGVTANGVDSYVVDFIWREAPNTADADEKGLEQLFDDLLVSDSPEKQTIPIGSAVNTDFAVEFVGRWDGTAPIVKKIVGDGTIFNPKRVGEHIRRDVIPLLRNYGLVRYNGRRYSQSKKQFVVWFHSTPSRNVHYVRGPEIFVETYLSQVTFRNNPGLVWDVEAIVETLKKLGIVTIEMRSSPDIPDFMGMTCQVPRYRINKKRFRRWAKQNANRFITPKKELLKKEAEYWASESDFFDYSDDSNGDEAGFIDFPPVWGGCSGAASMHPFSGLNHDPMAP